MNNMYTRSTMLSLIVYTIIYYIPIIAVLIYGLLFLELITYNIIL